MWPIHSCLQKPSHTIFRMIFIEFSRKRMIQFCLTFSDVHNLTFECRKMTVRHDSHASMNWSFQNVFKRFKLKRKKNSIKQEKLFFICMNSNTYKILFQFLLIKRVNSHRQKYRCTSVIKMFVFFF